MLKTCGGILLAVMLATVFACERHVPSQNAAQPSRIMSGDRNGDEYAVYSELITEKYNTVRVHSIVVFPHTIIDSSQPLDKQMQLVTHHLNNMPPGLIEDFVLINKTPRQLAKEFQLPVAVELYDEKLDATPGQPNAFWSRFYSVYPGAQGLLYLSRVGFNDSRDLALVYASNQAGALNGSANFVLLRKAHAKWNIESTMLLWVS